MLAKIVLGSTLGGTAAILIGLRRKISVVSINNAIAQAIVIGVSSDFVVARCRGSRPILAMRRSATHNEPRSIAMLTAATSRRALRRLCWAGRAGQTVHLEDAGTVPPFRRDREVQPHAEQARGILLSVAQADGIPVERDVDPRIYRSGTVRRPPEKAEAQVREAAAIYRAMTGDILPEAEARIRVKRVMEANGFRARRGGWTMSRRWYRRIDRAERKRAAKTVQAEA